MPVEEGHEGRRIPPQRFLPERGSAGRFPAAFRGYRVGRTAVAPRLPTALVGHRSAAPATDHGRDYPPPRSPEKSGPSTPRRGTLLRSSRAGGRPPPIAARLSSARSATVLGTDRRPPWGPAASPTYEPYWIVPDSLTMAVPAGRTLLIAMWTEPVSAPLAPSKIPVPPMTTSARGPPPTPIGPGLQAGSAGHDPLPAVSSRMSEPPARSIVRRSQLPPQPAPNTIISVAWPSGMTSPCPQETSGKPGHVMAGWIGSANVIVTDCVVAAVAGDVAAVKTAATATPTKSASLRNRFMIRTPD